MKKKILLIPLVILLLNSCKKDNINSPMHIYKRDYSTIEEFKNVYDEIDKKQDIKLNKLSMPTEYNLNTISISYYIPDYEYII